MEWMAIIGNSIQYIEAHIEEELSVERIARAANVSPFYFQKGFAMLCGFTVAEYIRNRRLALAGNALLTTDERIIDLALKYGYDSPDSFTRAFTRFHGATPAAVRRDGAMLRSFAPLKIRFSLEGGYLMDYRIEHKAAFTVIANAKEFPYEGAQALVPQFWQEHFAGGKGTVVMGTYGINIDEKMGMERFEYLIADLYTHGAAVPEGFSVREIPAFNWAIFPSTGALPNALQGVNQRIFTEWLPAMQEYEFAAGYCVEYYDDPSKYEKGTQDDKYYCEIWIPVKKK